jgi:mRNA interferase MazF
VTRGKIVLIPFPFDDLSSSKVRPALCLTDQIGPHCHVVVAFITSAPVDDPLNSDIVLDPSMPEFSSSGLRTRSTVRLHRLVTISSSMIVRTLGELSETSLVGAMAQLNRLFDPCDEGNPD